MSAIRLAQQLREQAVALVSHGQRQRALQHRAQQGVRRGAAAARGRRRRTPGAARGMRSAPGPGTSPGRRRRWAARDEQEMHLAQRMRESIASRRSRAPERSNVTSAISRISPRSRRFHRWRASSAQVQRRCLRPAAGGGGTSVAARRRGPARVGSGAVKHAVASQGQAVRTSRAPRRRAAASPARRSSPSADVDPRRRGFQGGLADPCLAQGPGRSRPAAVGATIARMKAISVSRAGARRGGAGMRQSLPGWRVAPRWRGATRRA